MVQFETEEISHKISRSNVFKFSNGITKLVAYISLEYYFKDD